MRKYETTIQVFDKETEDLGLKPRRVTIPFVLDLDEVVAMRPEISDEEPFRDGINFDGCIVYTRYGDSFWIRDSYELMKPKIFGNAN